MATITLPKEIQLKPGCTTCDSILEYLKHHIQQAHTGSDIDKDEKSVTEIKTKQEEQPLEKQSLNIDGDSVKMPVIAGVASLKPPSIDNVIGKDPVKFGQVQRDRKFPRKVKNKLPRDKVRSPFKPEQHVQSAQYSCDICDRKFTLKSNLVRHMKKTGRQSCLLDKSQTCYVCKEVFGEQLSYRHHVQNAHKIGDRYQCPLCSVTFVTRQNMLSHIRRVHEAKEQDQEDQVKLAEPEVNWSQCCPIPYQELMASEGNENPKTEFIEIDLDSSSDEEMDSFNIKEEFYSSATL